MHSFGHCGSLFLLQIIQRDSKKWAGGAGLVPLIAEVRAGSATFNPSPAATASLPREYPGHTPTPALTDRHTDTHSQMLTHGPSFGARRGQPPEGRRGRGARSEQPQRSPAGTRGHGCCPRCPGQSALPAPASAPAPEPANGEGKATPPS